MQTLAVRPFYRLAATLFGGWLLLGNAQAASIDLNANQQPIHAPKTRRPSRRSRQDSGSSSQES